MRPVFWTRNKPIISLWVHNQLDNWAVYCIEIGCFSQTQGSCRLWPVWTPPAWGGGESCHLSSHYKSYKNVLGLLCSSFHKPETGWHYKVKAYPARDEKLLVLETCFPNPPDRLPDVLDPGTESGFRDAGWGAEPEMGARGEVSLVNRELREK